MKKRRGRRKLKKDRIILIILSFLLLSFGIYYLINKNNNILEDNKILEEEKVKEYSINLIMGGDALIHDKLYNACKIEDGYDFKPVFTYLKEYLKDYDLAYYNQETVLGGTEIGLSSYPAFNSPYEVGDALIDAGFNMVSLATNHTLDRGEKAILNSINYWKDKDVLTAGSYSSFEDREEIRIKEVNNIKYTMLNYTYGTNGINVPSGKEYLVNVWPCNGNNPDNDTKYQEYKEVVKKDIERVRDKVDVLMVAMHWGVEYTHVPTSYQKDMAKFLSDNGVDIIIGTHPHVVMPVTWIGDTLVIYSLGNMISAQETKVDNNTTIGLLTSIKITKTVEDNNTSIKLSDLNNELIYTYYENYTNFKVIPFSHPDIKIYLNDYERLYNKYSNIVKDNNDNISVKPIQNDYKTIANSFLLCYH